jgi:hypothetical protein
MRTSSLVLLLLSSTLAISSAAQIPSLLVTPSKVTLVPGESHTFRAVGQDGRIIRGVQWSVSPAYAAELHSGDEVEVSSTTPKQFEVVAGYQGQRATASVTVVAGPVLPQGAVRWSVTELPGFKTVKITPAVPSAGGPDVFAEETNATDRVVRAYTDDGRELWRVGGATLTPELIAQQSDVSLNKKSICDSVKAGSTKKEVAGLKQAADFAANPSLFGRDRWDVEETGVTCHIYFDSSGSVTKKRRELTN